MWSPSVSYSSFCIIGQNSIMAALLLGMLLIPLVGCQKDLEIRHYEQLLPEGRTRLLGAIIPQEQKTWIFKMKGPEEIVGLQRDNFDKFIRAIRFSGENPTWPVIPEGWQKDAGQDQRFATFRIGPKEQGLELTVMSLDGKAPALTEIVNFWRQQMGLEVITNGAAAQLSLVSDKVSLADDNLALVVDLTSAAATAARKRPEPHGARPVELTYTVPEKWQKLSLTGERKAAFRVVEDDQVADVTVHVLGGNVVDNINRWRQEVGLEVLAGPQMEKEVTLIKMGAESAAFVDLRKPDGGPLSKRVLGVILPRGPRSWFFKMTGPHELVGQQKANFEAFVRSVQFP